VGVLIWFPAARVGRKVTGLGERGDLNGQRNAVKEGGQAMVELRA
jgi:hypothetical protein